MIEDEEDIDLTAPPEAFLPEDVDLMPHLEVVRELLADGCLTAALERFLELRREHPGHRQLKMMPLAVKYPTAVARRIDERTTESIVLCVPA